MITGAAKLLFCLLFMRILLLFEVVGWEGLEPSTNALKGHCSTN